MGKLGRIPGKLGLLLVLGFLAFLFLAMFKAPPTASKFIIEPLVELLKASVLMTLGYHIRGKTEEKS